MTVSWKAFVDGFRVGSDTGNIEALSALITDDFEWVTSEMDRGGDPVMDVNDILQDQRGCRNIR